MTKLTNFEMNGFNDEGNMDNYQRSEAFGQQSLHSTFSRQQLGQFPNSAEARQGMNPWTAVFHNSTIEERYREHTKKRYRWVKWKLVLGANVWLIYAIRYSVISLFNGHDPNLSLYFMISLALLTISPFFFVQFETLYTSKWLRNLQTFWSKWWRLAYTVSVLACFNMITWVVLT
jgi:hypothetical protein